MVDTSPNEWLQMLENIIICIICFAWISEYNLRRTEYTGRTLYAEYGFEIPHKLLSFEIEHTDDELRPVLRISAFEVVGDLRPRRIGGRVKQEGGLTKETNDGH